MRRSREAPAKSLLALAADRFGALREAERRLLLAVQAGESADCGPSGDVGDPENDPQHANSWHADREIRVALFSWLCLEPTARAQISHKGISVFAARFDARLDLGRTALTFPISLVQCRLPAGLDIYQAQLPALILTGSWIGTLSATVGNESSATIFGTGTRISGPVLLIQAKVEGETRLFSAHIDGPLECEGAWFHNPGGVALNCEGARISGGVHLRKQFRSDGEVRLRGANIGRGLDCSAAFLNSPGETLNAQGVKVAGSALFRDGFRAEGGIVFRGAEIGDMLDLAEANLTTGASVGINVSGARIKGDLRMQRVQVRPDAWYNFSGASCGTLIDDEKSWPAGNSRIFLDDFTYRLGHIGDTEARLRWLRRQFPAGKDRRRGDFHPSSYKHLAATLRAQGHEREATEILIGMARDRMLYARLGRWQRLWSGILWHVIRGGYKPLRAMIFLVVLWMANIVVFSVGYQAGLIGPTDQRAFEVFASGSHQVPAWYPPFQSVVYAIDTSLPVINLGQRDKWQPLLHPIDAKSPMPPDVGSVLLLWRWLAIAAGWFLSSMLVIGIAALVTKE
jgi:hypothetical protein